MRARRRTGIAVPDAVVVLTGASSGIGRATAGELARRGAAVVLASRDEASLREVADECRSAGSDVLVVPTDVSDEQSVDRLANAAVERFGRIDAWINSAAVMAYGRVDEIPTDLYRQVIETNLFGTVYGARAALRTFREQGNGVLVNISSLYAKLTSPYVSPYVASKYGVLGFSRCLREELAGDPDIQVCTVLPEAIDTPIFRHAANVTGREVTALPPAADPGRVVAAIVRCIERPKPEVTVGVAARLMLVGQIATRRFAVPQLYDRMAQFAMDRIGFRDRPADEHAGNVFAPQPDLNRVGGSWRDERRLARRLAGLALTTAPLAAGWWLQRRVTSAADHTRTSRRSRGFGSLRRGSRGEGGTSCGLAVGRWWRS